MSRALAHLHGVVLHLGELRAESHQRNVRGSAVTAGSTLALLRDADREVVVRRTNARLLSCRSERDPVLVDHESVGALVQDRVVAEHVLHVGRLPNGRSRRMLDVRVPAFLALDVEPINGDLDMRPLELPSFLLELVCHALALLRHI